MTRTTVMASKAKTQRGGFGVGVVVGLLGGLVLALGVAVFVTKAPVPFVDKVPGRTAEQDAAEAEKNRQWDPERRRCTAARPAAPPSRRPPHRRPRSLTRSARSPERQSRPPEAASAPPPARPASKPPARAEASASAPTPGRWRDVAKTGGLIRSSTSCRSVRTAAPKTPSSSGPAGDERAQGPHHRARAVRTRDVPRPPGALRQPGGCGADARPASASG